MRSRFHHRLGLGALGVAVLLYLGLSLVLVAGLVLENHRLVRMLWRVERVCPTANMMAE